MRVQALRGFESLPLRQFKVLSIPETSKIPRGNRVFLDSVSLDKSEAKVRAGKPERWTVGEGAYIQVARVAKRSTAAWVFRYQVGGQRQNGRLWPLPARDSR